MTRHSRTPSRVLVCTVSLSRKKEIECRGPRIPPRATPKLAFPRAGPPSKGKHEIRATLIHPRNFETSRLQELTRFCNALVLRFHAEQTSASSTFSHERFFKEFKEQPSCLWMPAWICRFRIRYASICTAWRTFESVCISCNYNV